MFESLLVFALSSPPVFEFVFAPLFVFAVLLSFVLPAEFTFEFPLESSEFVLDVPPPLLEFVSPVLAFDELAAPPFVFWFEPASLVVESEF